MPDRTPAEKLRLKPGMTAAILHQPTELDGVLGVPEGVRLTADPSEADFILDFASTLAEANERLAELSPAVRPKTVTWMGYPKGSKAKGYDLNRDSVAAAAAEVGLIVNANFSIDEKWSALRMRPAN